MEFSGKVIFVSEVASGVSERGEWKRQSFVLEECNGQQYPKKASFEAFNDTVNNVPNPGDVVKVQFDINAREYNGRYFNTLRVWAIEHAAQTAIEAEAKAQQAPEQPAANNANYTGPVVAEKEKKDDLPF